MLTTGETKDPGKFELTLVSPSGAKLEISVGPFKPNTSATDKANAINSTVQVDSFLTGFTADLNLKTNTLTFKHKEGRPPKFVDVNIFETLKDGTGEKQRITASAFGIFQFGISNSLAAAGVDGNGSPSFASVQTRAGSATVPISLGETAESLVSSLFTELQGEGLDILRTAPTMFQITDRSPNAFIEFQVTDLNLPVQGAGGVSVVPEPSALVLGEISALVGLGCWSRRRRLLRIAGQAAGSDRLCAVERCWSLERGGVRPIFRKRGGQTDFQAKF
jgi:hypothetical protein